MFSLLYVIFLFCCSNSPEVRINPELRHQKVLGFGAAMTASSAWLLMKKLGPEASAQAMERLFGPEGAAIGALRLPMGSSDFSLEAYSYSDLPGHFSIEKDKEFIIPALQAALKINSNLVIIASPWSAPAWMKTGGLLFGGKFVDSPENLKAYAVYFRKFVQSYQALGIPIYAVTLQNEPEHDSTGLPSMHMSAGQQAALAILVANEFQAAGLRTKIIAWDHNWDNTAFAAQILSNSAVAQYIDGTAFHAYAGEVGAQSKLKEQFPGKNIYFTEISGGGWGGGFSSDLMWNAKNVLIGATRNWAKVVLNWNLILDAENGPFLPGGCSNCTGLIQLDRAGELVFQHDYYALTHLSRFVRPGAERIHSSHPDSVAFMNPGDSEIVVLLLNPQSEPYTYQVQLDGQVVPFEMPPQSIGTVVWARESKIARFWVTSGDKKHLLAEGVQ